MKNGIKVMVWMFLLTMLFSCTTISNINGLNKRTYEATRKDLIKNKWVEIKVKPGYMMQIKKHIFFIVYQNYILRPALVETQIDHDKNFDFYLVHWGEKPNDPNFMAWACIKYQGKDHYFIKINYDLETDFTYKYDLYDSDNNYLRKEEIKVFF